jgi:two-component system sensor histidine kinase KdpD
MRLHKNIALNLALVVLGLIVIFYLLSTFVLMSEFSSLEYQQARSDMEGVYSVFRTEVRGLEGITRDWSSWDDTYDFIETASTAYISSNMVDGTFINNRLNAVLYINQSGGLVYGEAFDFRLNERRDLPSDLLPGLEEGGAIRAVMQSEQGRTDIIRSSEGLFMLSTMPILTSENMGPARGVLVMGRCIDAGMIEGFEEVASLPLQIVLVSDLPAEVTEMYPDLSEDHPYVIIPVNETRFDGYLFFEDIHGDPGAIFRASIPRDFSSQGIALSRYFFSLLIAVAIVFGIIVMIILERKVLSRVDKLSSSVAEIETSGDLTRRFPEEGDDEFAAFSKGMNRMLAALSKAESAVGMQNQQLIAVNDIISAVSRSDTSEQIFSTSLQKTVDTLGFEMGAMFSINLDTKKAELKAHTGIPSDRLPVFLASGSTIEIHRSPHEPVFTSAVPVYYEGDSGDLLDRESMPILSSLGIRSLAVIPLASGSAVLGVLYTGWTRPHRFTDYEKGILTTIGQEVGNALFKGVLQDKLVAAMTRADISHERAEKARDEANFYLDIMTHDINNVNQSAMGYLLLLSESEGGSQDELLRKLENTVTKSSDIIRQVTVIRRIRETHPALKSMDLDRVISDVIQHYADERISYQGSPQPVYADELIPEIFLNLIGNALKFGGPENIIRVEVRPREEMLEVTVRDNGPGIPDSLKPLLFQKYQRGTTAKSGKGLGLYIVRMLVERYGGWIWAEDAVPGSPDQGAAVKFTLRKGDLDPEPSPGNAK